MRVRILLTALLIAAVAGLIELPLPAEDAFRGLRNKLMERPSSGEIVIVAIDDRTLKALATDNPGRDQDAIVIENLMAMGAKRVAFDRIYADPSEPDKDARLVEVVNRYPGQIIVGAGKSADDARSAPLSLLPHAFLRDHVVVRSLVGRSGPFGLSILFPFAAKGPHGLMPSLASELGHLTTPSLDTFRPDYAIQASTVPTVSFVDVLNARVPSSVVHGKDVLIAPTALSYHDYKPMAFQGWVAGGYFHVIAAETLRRGIPVRVAWPLPLFATALLLWQMCFTNRQPRMHHYLMLPGGLLILPFAFDLIQVDVEVLPALIAAGIVLSRTRTRGMVDDARNTDAVTGMPNFNQLLDEDAQETGTIVALKIRDLAEIEATLGGDAAERVIEQILRCARLTNPKLAVFRNADILLWRSSLVSNVDLIQHLGGLQRLMSQGVAVGDTLIDIKVAFGVNTTVGQPLASSINAAIAAVTRAEKNGVLMEFHQGDEEAIDREWRLSILSNIDRAMRNSDLWVAYQPQLHIASQRIDGAEALIRWTDPRRGIIGPDRFIPEAEQDANRILKLTNHVLETVCLDLPKLLDIDPDFKVAMNLSANLLDLPELPEMVFGTLMRHRLPLSSLVMEVTETASIDTAASHLAIMRSMARLGLSFSIDDFGTGNATVDYLKKMPAKEIKIDRQFFRAIDQSTGDYILVASMVQMAKGLDMTVVAEGIENAASLHLAARAGCTHAQGYYVGKPDRIEKLLDVMKSNQIEPPSQRTLRNP